MSETCVCAHARACVRDGIDEIEKKLRFKNMKVLWNYTAG